MTRPPRRRVPNGLAGRGEDQGSLALAMLFVMVGVSLTALMTPILLRQVVSSRTAMNWAHALSATEAGLQVALAQIRASDGLIAALPCGPLEGEVNPEEPARYKVSIDYLTADPAGNVSANYLTSNSPTDLWVSNHRITCAGAGATTTPKYALLRSLGTALPTGPFTTVPNRAVWAQYKFATTNVNIPGGVIRTWPTGITELCFDAGSAQPPAGTDVRMQPCTGGAQQTWAYMPNLTLMLVSTKDSTPRCLDASSPHVVGAVVTLQTCGTTTQPRQQWSYNPTANFEGTSDGVTRDGYCLNVESPNAANSRVVLGSTASLTCLNHFSERMSFEPEPVVGAGAAPATSSGSTQLVNYKQFGRCVDLPGANPTVNYTYVMAWTCKQEPSGNVEWNQMWTLPTPVGAAITASGQLATTCNNTPSAPAKCTNGVAYCLKSPLSTAGGMYVAPVVCSIGDAAQTWTRYGANATTYDQRYQIVDSGGRCLTPLENVDLANGFSKIVVRTCDGSTLQKWNAAPNLDNGLPLQNVGER